MISLKMHKMTERELTRLILDYLKWAPNSSFKKIRGSISFERTAESKPDDKNYGIFSISTTPFSSTKGLDRLGLGFFLYT